MHDYEFLQKCLKAIEAKLSWGSSENWTNSEFTKLSELILEKTKISISISSLRRLFGKATSYKKIYNPQMETKNALAVFLDFENWADYLKKNNGAFAKSTNIKIRPVFIIVALLVVAVVFVLLKYINKPNTETKTPVSQEIDIDKIYFKVKNRIGKDIPHTVQVSYNIDSITPPVFIDFGEKPPDGSKRPKPKKLEKNKYTFSHTYVTKSSFIIKLLDENGNVITKGAPVHIETQGWEAYVSQENKKIVFDSSEVFDNGLMQISNKDIHFKKIDTLDVYRTFYRNIKDFNISCDSLEFTTKIKAEFRKGFVECNHVQLELLADSSRIFITIMKPGCQGRISELAVSEKIFNGRDDDLSLLGLELEKWGELKLKTIDNKFVCFYNNKAIFETNYKVPLGTLQGIRFEFKGRGVVDYISIKESHSGNYVYKEDF